MLRIVLVPVLVASLLAGSMVCCCLEAPGASRSPSQSKGRPLGEPMGEGCCCKHADETAPATPRPFNQSCTCKQKQPQALSAADAAGPFPAKALPYVDLVFTVQVLLIPEPRRSDAAVLPSGWFADSGEMLRALRVLRL